MMINNSDEPLTILDYENYSEEMDLGFIEGQLFREYTNQMGMKDEHKAIQYRNGNTFATGSVVEQNKRRS
jgi:hypothetical protein